MATRRMKLTAAEVALIEERRRLDTAFNAGLDAALRCFREYTGFISTDRSELISVINASERKEVL